MSRTTLAVAAVVLAVVLLAAEGTTRLLAPHLPEPELWADASTATKVAQMDALEDRLGCVDVVFAGNSMTRDGVDPPVFTAADPARRTAYNASLDAATPELLERWVPEQVDPRLHPDTVVIGLSSFDLNDEAAITRSALEAFDTAPMTRDDVYGTLERPLIDHLALFRHRVELRDPEVVWESVQRWIDGEQAEHPDPAGIPDLIGPLGQGLSRQGLTYEGSAVAQQFVLDQLLNDYAPDGDQRAALARLAGDLADRGHQVVLLVLPVTDDYQALHPGGPADFDAFLDEAAEVAEQAGADLVDAHDWAPGDEVFADTHHLNGAGAAAFSAALPGLLPAPPEDAGC